MNNLIELNYWHYDRYVELRMSGELMPIAHKINDDAYETIDHIVGKCKDNMSLLIAEGTVTREIVLIVR